MILLVSTPWMRYGLLVCIVLLCGDCVMKYTVLQGTGLPNPPEERMGILVGRFPVRSMATRNLLRWEKQRTDWPGPMGQARQAPKLKRPLSFDRLDKEIRDALSEEQVCVLDFTATPDPQKARRVPNLFRLTDKSEAVLEIEGRFSVNSRDLRTMDCSLSTYESSVKNSDPLFSEDIYSFDIYVVLTDLRTRKMVAEVTVNRPAKIPFDSPDLKDIMVASLMAILAEQTPF